MSFRDTEIQHHLSFFKTYSASWLNPEVLSSESSGSEVATGRTSLFIYPSYLTNDHTPLEFSCCWKSQSSNGFYIPRYVFEVASYDGKTRQSSLARGLSAIQTLEDARGLNLDLHLFTDLWKQIFQTLLSKDYAIHPNGGQCLPCGPASTFIGYDLGPGIVRTKLYWILPCCLPIPDLLSLLDNVFIDASIAAPVFLSPSFSSVWSMVKTYLSSVATNVRIPILSVDATKYPVPRVKLYIRCLLHGKRLDFASQILPHLTLNGKIAIDEDFKQTCDALWTGLLRSIPPSAAKPRYVLLLYDMAGAQLTSKLYIMCQDVPLSDAVIAKVLLESCSTMKNSAMLTWLAQQQRSTAYINEIGLAPRGKQTEAAIYLNPCYYSKNQWARQEDGSTWMRKKKITSIYENSR